MNKKNKVKNVLREPEINENVEFYDPDDANLDAYQFQQTKDDQYKQLLGANPAKKVKINSFFENDEKYSGKKYQPEISDQQQPQDQIAIKTVLKQLKANKKQRVYSSLLEERIEQIKKQDQQVVFEAQKTNQNSEAAQHLNNQFRVHDNLVQIRYHFEKSFQDIKRFPTQNIQRNDNLDKLNKDLEINLINNLKNIEKIQFELWSKIHGHQQQQFSVQDGVFEELYGNIDRANHSLNVQKIYQQYKLNTKNIDRHIQDSLIKWSNKTVLNNNISSSSYSSLIMQTPIGQAKKIFTSMDKILTKSRSKRKIFKVLFKQPETIKETTDNQIFDDFDLFNEVSKTFQKQIQKDEDGLLITDTRKYLKERNSRESGEKKQVDRKASKNRKIRYNVHAKLLNFMPSQENPFIMQARDQIIKNIFNSAPKQQIMDYIDL